jgi:hypothetical protein
MAFLWQQLVYKESWSNGSSFRIVEVGNKARRWFRDRPLHQLHKLLKSHIESLENDDLRRVVFSFFADEYIRRQHAMLACN